MELKITKERVLEAAAGCSTAKATLEKLFPEVFKDNKVTIRVFDNVYCVKTGNRLLENRCSASDRFWLGSQYTWEIRPLQGGEDGYELIPTLKP